MACSLIWVCPINFKGYYRSILFRLDEPTEWGKAPRDLMGYRLRKITILRGKSIINGACSMNCQSLPESFRNSTGGDDIPVSSPHCRDHPRPTVARSAPRFLSSFSRKLGEQWIESQNKNSVKLRYSNMAMYNSTLYRLFSNQIWELYSDHTE